MFDKTSHELMEALLPIGAARVWDTCAQYAVPPLATWDEQDERTRARFTIAFADGIEAMAEAAG